MKRKWKENGKKVKGKLKENEKKKKGKYLTLKKHRGEKRKIYVLKVILWSEVKLSGTMTELFNQRDIVYFEYNLL